MQFESAVQLLCDAGVDFVVIGGVAATFHGSVRVTYDLDICYSRVSSNVRSLAAALAPFHPRPRGFADDLPFIWDEATVRNSTLLTLRTDLGEIDLLAEVAGLGSYSEVKEHSLMVNAFGRQLRALDLQSLILAKRTAGREKDLSALPELESLLEAGEM
jgi:predicted nucleotidyltransferase